jgi:hypothetical protein
LNAASVAGVTGATFANPGVLPARHTGLGADAPRNYVAGLHRHRSRRLISNIDCVWGRVDPSAIGTPNVYDAPQRFDENLVREQLKMLKERSCASP